MRNPKAVRIASVLGALVLILAGVWWVQLPDDPMFKGRRLSSWVQEEGYRAYREGFEIGDLPPDVRLPRPSQIEAVSAVGTNGLPLLVRMLGAKKSRLASRLESFTQQYPIVQRFIRTPKNEKLAMQAGALNAFAQLGQRASPAIPMILPLLTDPGCAGAAIAAIRLIEPDREENILPLTNAFSIAGGSLFQPPPTYYHRMALAALGSLGTKASNAAPMIVNLLHSTNEDVRASAAIALARIGAPPEEIVPMILSNLLTIKPTIPPPGAGAGLVSTQRGWVPVAWENPNLVKFAWALGKYGRGAKSALPVLSNAIASATTRETKEEITHAMWRIVSDTNDVSRAGADPFPPKR